MPCTARVAVEPLIPLLYEIVIVDDEVPDERGANVATTVQVAEALSVEPQVPPVPGNAPPLNENGDARPEPLRLLAVTPPVF